MEATYLSIRMAAYFTSSKRGEVSELQEELNSTKADRKREALKKVIAAMTVGKDVSALFPHVVKCMETPNIELKKLVYLYIINYAKSQPDVAIMAVNSFIKDARQKANPLVRALAVRTMGYIRVQKITEYLFEPLRDSLVDQDPYVRKTAAVCVAKLYDISPEMVEDQDMLGALASLISDQNAMVVANAIASINEITEMRGRPFEPLNSNVVGRVLSSLNDSNEWGQIQILDFVATYVPSDSQEAEGIIERVQSRLVHGNPAVALAVIKLIFKYLDYISNPEVIRTIGRKLTPPLVTLLSGPGEIVYVALRSISLIVQKRPFILEKDIKFFFCKYNDPTYVKLEKLDIIVKLVDLRNVDMVLAELKEYASEVDPEFVGRSVKALGRCALKLEKATERCLMVLLELIHTRSQYILQEAVIVLRDIFRKYPGRYERILTELFQNLETLEDTEARASLIWMLGEYAELLPTATAQLQTYVSGFLDEPANVQFQLLTATVKLYLKVPADSEEMIMSLLRLVTTECASPDMRDRAYLYWRLLASDPEKAKRVVMCERPVIIEEAGNMDPSLLDKLLEQLGTLASIYHKNLDAGIGKVRERAMQGKENPQELVDEEAGMHPEEDSAPPKPQVVDSRPGVDLLNLMDDLPRQPEAVKTQRAAVPMQVVLSADTPGTHQQRGLQVEMAFQRESGQIYLDLRMTNFSENTLTDFAIQFNVNFFGLSPAAPLDAFELPRNAQQSLRLRITPGLKVSNDPPTVPYLIQMALKSSLDIFYFQAPCMFTVLLVLSM